MGISVEITSRFGVGVAEESGHCVLPQPRAFGSTPLSEEVYSPGWTTF